ncbi:hypothetical protein QVD17_03286 [Tagetes erecta]|uniref:Uncharacterized protein n=1 Tax=Tagetes erecta TaxID=13708 RepID=A0AAD8L838_TARER|nr:hypothetical protein QVD17_03286 [Tagetes erecta]
MYCAITPLLRKEASAYKMQLDCLEDQKRSLNFSKINLCQTLMKFPCHTSTNGTFKEANMVQLVKLTCMKNVEDSNVYFDIL